MTKEQLLLAIKGYSKCFLKNAGSIQRRINCLADIEFAAQEAREALEAAFDDLDDKRTPIGFGYYAAGRPYFDADEQRADRKSTCRITPLYDESDKENYLAGSTLIEDNTFG